MAKVIENKNEAYALDIRAANGVRFRLLAEFATPDPDGRRDGLVEVYDMRFTNQFGPRGQFTGARCYVSSLLGEDGYSSGVGGWNLDGGIESWSIDAASMSVIRSWLRLTRKRDRDHVPTVHT